MRGYIDWEKPKFQTQIIESAEKIAGSQGKLAKEINTTSPNLCWWKKIKGRIPIKIAKKISGFLASKGYNKFNWEYVKNQIKNIIPVSEIYSKNAKNTWKGKRYLLMKNKLSEGQKKRYSDPQKYKDFLNIVNRTNKKPEYRNKMSEVLVKKSILSKKYGIKEDRLKILNKLEKINRKSLSKLILNNLSGLSLARRSKLIKQIAFWNYPQNISQKEIGAMFYIGEETVRKILMNKSWYNKKVKRRKRMAMIKAQEVSMNHEVRKKIGISSIKAGNVGEDLSLEDQKKRFPNAIFLRETKLPNDCYADIVTLTKNVNNKPNIIISEAKNISQKDKIPSGETVLSTHKKYRKFCNELWFYSWGKTEESAFKVAEKLGITLILKGNVIYKGRINKNAFTNWINEYL